jgi:CRISPR/Cas system-associated endoribonuclease Cas2
MRFMTRRRKVAVAAGAGAIVLVVAGLGAAGAIAASSLFHPREEAQAVIDDAADQLGVEPSERSDALQQALENRIDEGVREGRLTEEQAERMKERLDSGAPFFFGFGGTHGRSGFHGHGGRFQSLERAASYLGLTEDELREALRNSTLAEIAEDRDKPVAGLVDVLVATQAERIDEAVDEGRLSEEQATELKNGLEERTEALVNGELRRPGDSRQRFWHGSGSPRGPPGFGGPRA